MNHAGVTRLEAVWHFCRDHESLIRRSARCGCFYCESFFLSHEIEEWVDDLSTARSPGCGVDAVLPDVPLYDLNAELLREMHAAYFLSAPREAAAQQVTTEEQVTTEKPMS